MKLYLRLIDFARPLSVRVIPYGIFTFLAVIFGLLNFTLLIPLLDVLFDNTKQITVSEPQFSFTVDYFLQVFNFYFYSIINEYGRLRALQFVCLLVVFSVLMANIFRYFSQVQVEKLRTHTLINIRNSLYEKVISFHYGYFSNERKGDIMTKMTQNVNEVDYSIGSTLSVFFKEPLTLIFSFVALFNISPKLTLFTLITIPVSGVIISSFTKKLRRDSHEMLDALSKLMSNIDETLYGIKIILGFGANKFASDSFKRDNLNFNIIQQRLHLRREFATPFSEFTGVLVVAMILLYGGSLVISNDASLSASAFIAYIILFSQVLRPAKALSTAFTGMQRGMAAAERMFDFLDQPILIKNTENPISINEFSNEIRFENVTFSYDKKKVLKNLSFTVKKGQMVALVGPSGGGKSTIVDLLPRFYDPKEGTIFLDSNNLKNIDLQSLRNQLGLVTQESFLFNDSIYNNIVFGKTDATPEQVEQAAKIANAHEFILKTENGYQTIIGDRGMKLSGGQKQRLSIARAVLRNPPILILDEATSALDTESEKLVQNALDNLMKNRTTLVIAHRLSTVQHADVILVIKEGEIVESGTHEELIKIPNGTYQLLSKMQNYN